MGVHKKALIYSRMYFMTELYTHLHTYTHYVGYWFVNDHKMSVSILINEMAFNFDSYCLLLVLILKKTARIS